MYTARGSRTLQRDSRAPLALANPPAVSLFRRELRREYLCSLNKRLRRSKIHLRQENSKMFNICLKTILLYLLLRKKDIKLEIYYTYAYERNCYMLATQSI